LPADRAAKPRISEASPIASSDSVERPVGAIAAGWIVASHA
jgi:hypothetical protein